MLNLRLSLSASFLIGLAVVGLGAAGGACGQSVATCSSVCPAINGLSGCEPQCEAEQSACMSIGHAADFQTYLTCVANAGGFPEETPLDPNGGPSPGTTEATTCATQLALVTSECGTGSPMTVGTGSTLAPDAGATSLSDSSVGTALDATLSSPPDAGADSGPQPIPDCVTLEACCTEISSSEYPDCNTAVGVGDAGSCANNLSILHGLGLCLAITLDASP
jgi:hypothetical protein